MWLARHDRLGGYGGAEPAASVADSARRRLAKCLACSRLSSTTTDFGSTSRRVLAACPGVRAGSSPRRGSAARSLSSICSIVLRLARMSLCCPCRTNNYGVACGDFRDVYLGKYVMDYSVEEIQPNVWRWKIASITRIIRY